MHVLHLFFTLKEHAADIETSFEEGIKAADDEVASIHVYTLCISDCSCVYACICM